MEKAVGVPTQRGRIYLKEQNVPSYDIAIVIGIRGDLVGLVVLSLESSVAERVASSMLMGMPVTGLSELAISAISELANMIVGNASITLARQAKCICDISVPKVLTNYNLSDFKNNIRTICIPVKTEIGDFEINIGITGEK